MDPLHFLAVRHAAKERKKYFKQFFLAIDSFEVTIRSRIQAQDSTRDTLLSRFDRLKSILLNCNKHWELIEHESNQPNYHESRIKPYFTQMESDIQMVLKLAKDISELLSSSREYAAHHTSIDYIPDNDYRLLLDFINHLRVLVNYFHNADDQLEADMDSVRAAAEKVRGDIAKYEHHIASILSDESFDLSKAA